jgi:hypothetical protein
MLSVLMEAPHLVTPEATGQGIYLAYVHRLFDGCSSHAAFAARGLREGNNVHQLALM